MGVSSRRHLAGLSLASTIALLLLSGCNTTDGGAGLSSIGSVVTGQSSNTLTSGSGGGTGTTGFVSALASNSSNIASDLDQSTENQKAQGRKALDELRQKGQIVEKSKLAARLTKVARKMGSTKAAGQHPYQFEVYVTTETMMNAYTSGGGIIFVTQGLVDKVPNEAQMAAVLSHEMAHVIKSHTAQRRSTNMLTRIGLTAAETYSPTTLTSQAAQMGSSVAVNASLNVYSRGQELEADDYGVEMLIEAGYEPGEMVRVFELFERENGTQPEMTSLFFNSHPSDDERIKKLRALLKEQAPTLAGRKFIKDTPEYQALTRSSRKIASTQ